MDWAQAEAAKARREAESVENNEQHLTTLEEVALAQLFEAHSVVADALKQYDDLEKMAADEQEMRAVQERSKKETRLDRRVSWGKTRSQVLTLCSSRWTCLFQARPPKPLPPDRHLLIMLLLVEAVVSALRRTMTELFLTPRHRRRNAILASRLPTRFSCTLSATVVGRARRHRIVEASLSRPGCLLHPLATRLLWGALGSPDLVLYPVRGSCALSTARAPTASLV